MHRVGWVVLALAPLQVFVPRASLAPVPMAVKDKAAILVAGKTAFDHIVIDDAGKANLADIVLGRIQMRQALPAEAEGRACARVAVFTAAEWTRTYLDLIVGPETVEDIGLSPCPLPATTLSAGTPPPAAAPDQQNRNVITREQIAEAGVTNAYDAIRRLRPQFLQRRRSSDVSGEVNLPVLYVDQARFDELERLEEIPADQVQEIRYLSGPDATTRFGTGHSAGAILVTTRR